MLLTYNLVTRLYFLLIRVASVLSPKAYQLYHGQKRALTEIKSYFDSNQNHKVIWIHAASLGEFEQGRPVIEALKSQNSEVKVFLTFFSPSGYEVRKDYDKADLVTYLPFDTQGTAQELIGLVNPTMIIFIKYEFWYHYIEAAHTAGISLVSISTIFKPSQPFFKPYGVLHRKMLSRFNHFFVQNDQSLSLLDSINMKNATISGDTRYDRVIDISAKRPNLDVIESFVSDEKVLVIGSSWPSDMRLIEEGLMSLRDSIKIIIAPHNVDDTTISELQGKLDKSIRFSEAGQTSTLYNRIMIIDNMGMLSTLYGYADVAYVGGGARGALHNTLEPATWGIPVLFAGHEKNNKFQEAIDLVRNGGAFEILSSEDFKQKLSSIMLDDNERKKCGKLARKQVEENAGATGVIMKYLAKRTDD